MQWGVEKCCSVVVSIWLNHLPAGFKMSIWGLCTLSRINGRHISSFHTVVLLYNGVSLESVAFLRVHLIVSRRFVLYMKFYPSRMKYIDPNVETYSQRNVKTSVRSSEWRFSLFCAWLTFAHLYIILAPLFQLLMPWFDFSLFCGATTLCLLSITGSQSSPPTVLPSVMQSWGTVLGVTSAILAAIQYTPQLIHTYRMKLVGALSIPMMCMQSPGAVLMILGIALRWVLWLFTELTPFDSCFQSWYKLDKLVSISGCGNYAGLAPRVVHFVEDAATQTWDWRFRECDCARDTERRDHTWGRRDGWEDSPSQIINNLTVGCWFIYRSHSTRFLLSTGNLEFSEQ